MRFCRIWFCCKIDSEKSEKGFHKTGTGWGSTFHGVFSHKILQNGLSEKKKLILIVLSTKQALRFTIIFKSTQAFIWFSSVLQCSLLLQYFSLFSFSLSSLLVLFFLFLLFLLISVHARSFFSCIVFSFSLPPLMVLFLLILLFMLLFSS